MVLLAAQRLINRRVGFVPSRCRIQGCSAPDTTGAVVKIRELQQAAPGTLDITGQLSEAEYAALGGKLNDLCLFAADSISQSASVIKTGARHSYAKYLLFPVALRRKWRTDG